MSAREELISLLRTTMDEKDAMAVADAYRTEVQREAAGHLRLVEPDEMDDVDAHLAWNWAADTLDPDI
jgi:hypothetical protein